MSAKASSCIKARAFGAVFLVGVALLGSGVSIAEPKKPVPGGERPEGARKIFEESRSRIYQIRTLTVDGGAQNSTGSGFLVGKDGLIATNWHVISDYILDPGRYRLEAIRTDGRKIAVSAVAIDSMNDLALLKADGESGIPFSMHQSVLAKNVMGGGESSVTLLLATFTIGIGIGSMLCERMSGKNVEIGLVPFGSIGLTLFGLDLYFASPVALVGTTPHELLALLSLPAIWRVLFDLMMLGLFGGFFIVPLYALVQLRSSDEHRARIIAANNIVNALFMVVGALLAGAALGAGLSIPALFGIAALLNALVAIYIYRLVPEFLIRFIAWLLIKAAYRLRTEGAGQIPAEGAALLVCNHVSFVDSLIIMSASPRPVRFVMDHRIFRLPLLSYIFRHGRAIPIAAAKDDPLLMESAFADISTALKDGELVAIFPEGGLTPDGELQAFRPGITRILASDPVAVVPMALSGLWGSYFSRIDGAAMKTPFRRGWFSRISLRVGTPLAAESAHPETLQRHVAELRGRER